ncbi:MAG: hypothetical protein PVF31_05295, partial [Desulfobacterales bacterium]
ANGLIPFHEDLRPVTGSTYLFCVHTGDCFYYANGFIVKAANKRIAKADGFCYSDAYSRSAGINYNHQEHEGHKE